MRTANEQRKWELGAWGCTKKDLLEIAKDNIRGNMVTHTNIAMSMLSDAQEQMRFDTEQARQTINRAKWFMNEGERQLRMAAIPKENWETINVPSPKRKVGDVWLEKGVRTASDRVWFVQTPRGKMDFRTKKDAMSIAETFKS